MKWKSVHDAAKELGWRSTRDFTAWCRERGVPVKKMSHKKILVDTNALEHLINELQD